MDGDPRVMITAAPRVLITNDDGVDAHGLRVAVRAVQRAGGEPIVVAPSTDMSLTGMALSGDFGQVPLHAQRVRWVAPGLEDVEVYRLAAYPSALVTVAAAGGFGRRPDLVLSGVNHGLNTGVGVVHSATVGAALTGGLAGIPALAVSVAGPGRQVDWGWCEEFVANLLGVLAEGVPPSGALNVNLPTRPPGPGLVDWCPLATSGVTAGHLDRQVSDGGDVTLRMRYEPTAAVLPYRSDTAALLRGEASLTWLSLPHGQPAPARWQRAVLGRVRAGWPAIATVAGTLSEG